MSNLWCKIKIGNQTEIDAKTITPNLQFLELDTAPVFTNNVTNIVGVDGGIFNGNNLEKSIVNLKFVVYFTSFKDFILAKHDIYSTFMTHDEIRIRTNQAPNKVYYCRSVGFNIQIKKVGQNGAVFTIPLENVYGVCYSICNSDELENIQDDNNWSYGMNIPTGTKLQYHFNNTNSFDIYNPSDKVVNPYLQNDKLTIKLSFNGGNFTLTNTTNGSNWSYNKGSNGSDTFLINGVESSLNGNPCTRDTNYGHIILEKGNNHFTINGTNNDIIFSFPFVYIA